jgi:ribosomal protein L32
MLPTHRQSPGRKRRRRSHLALSKELGTLCPVTNQPKRHHRACPESGYYRPGLTVRVPKLGIGTER